MVEDVAEAPGENFTGNRRATERTLHLPESFYIGQAAGQGDCFFDSVAQGLSQIRPKGTFTIKSLRMVCKSFAQRSLHSGDGHWLCNILDFEAKSNNELPLDRYIDSVEFTAAETVNDPVLQDGPVWGRPEIEGRILCQEFCFKLHVAERHRGLDLGLWTNDEINASGARSVAPRYDDENTVHIANCNGYHFEPILRRNCFPATKLQHLGDECQMENSRADEILSKLSALFSGDTSRTHVPVLQDPLWKNPVDDTVDCEDTGRDGWGKIRDAVNSNDVDLVRRLLRQFRSWPFDASDRESDDSGSLWSSMGVEKEGVYREMQGILEEEVRLRKCLLGIAQLMTSARDIARKSSEKPEVLMSELLHSTHEALTSWIEFQERSLGRHHHKLALLLFSLVAHNVERLREQSDKLGLPRTVFGEVTDCLSGLLVVLVDHERLRLVADNVMRVKTELLQGLFDNNVADNVGKCDSLMEDIRNFSCQMISVDSVKCMQKCVEKLQDEITEAKCRVEELDGTSMTSSPETSLSVVREKLILDLLTMNLQAARQEDAYRFQGLLLVRISQLCHQSTSKSLQSLSACIRPLEVDRNGNVQDLLKKIQAEVQQGLECLGAERTEVALGYTFSSQEDILNKKSGRADDGYCDPVTCSRTPDGIIVRFSQLLSSLPDFASMGDRKSRISKDCECAEVTCAGFVYATTQTELKRVVQKYKSSGHGKIPGAIEGSVDRFISHIFDGFLNKPQRSEVPGLPGESPLTMGTPREIADDQRNHFDFQTLHPLNSTTKQPTNQTSQTETLCDDGSMLSPNLRKPFRERKGHSDSAFLETLSHIRVVVNDCNSFAELLQLCKRSLPLRCSLESLVWESLMSLKSNSSQEVYACIEDVLQASVALACPFAGIGLLDYLRPGSLLAPLISDRLLITAQIGHFLSTDGETLMAIQDVLKSNGGKEFLVNALGASFSDEVLTKPISKYDESMAIIKTSRYWTLAHCRRNLMALLKSGQVALLENQQYVWHTFEQEVFDRCSCDHLDFWTSRIDLATIRDLQGYTPLHAVCETGEVSLMKRLLEIDSDINAVDKESNTPLHVASLCGHHEVVKTLLDSSAKVDQPNDRCLTALHVAASCGHLQVVEMLLDHGSDANATTSRGFTPLFFALPHPPVVKVLLDLGANINARNEENSTPLHEASRFGQEESIELLIERGAKLNAIDNSYGTALHTAVVHGQSDVVRMLLHHGADPHDVCRSRNTLVHHAAFVGHADILQVLLDKGLKVDERDERGMTPLHSAVLGGHPGIMDVLGHHLPTPAFVNTDDARQRTALHYAAARNDFRLTEALVRLGASVNVTDEEGNMPLHLAAMSGAIEVAALLIAEGSKTSTLNCNSQTPSIVAHQFGHEDFRESLNLTGELPKPIGSPIPSGAIASPIVEDADKNLAELNKTCSTAGVQTDSKQTTSLFRSESVQNSQLSSPEAVAEQNPETREQANPWSPIHSAVVNGDVDIVRTLLINKGGVDRQGGDANVTPLHLAAELGRTSCVEVLLKKGAHVDAVCGFHGRTALHLASRNGHAEVVQKLITARAEVDDVDEKGNTPLHLAAEAGEAKVAEMLINGGANINARNEDGSTPLHLARVELIAGLVRRGADIEARDSRGRTPLFVAIDAGSPESVAALLESGADADEGGLHSAVSRGSWMLTRLLVVGGASVNRRDTSSHTPLHIACQTGACHLVRLLIEGADLDAEDAEGLTPLMEAIRSGRADVARDLLLAGADAEQRSRVHGVRPLHAAIAGRKLDLLRVLLDGGANVNARSRQGLTPLWMAAFHGLPEAVRLLLERGANVNVTDRWNNAPLHTAARAGHAGVVEVLLLGGAAVDALNDRNRSPLHEAIEGRHREAVAVLLSRAASLDIPLEKTLAALHLAAAHGDLDIVRLLLAAGAEVNVHDRDRGKTPLHYAAQNGHLEVAQHLVLSGAQVDAKDTDCWTPLRLAIGLQNLPLVVFLLDSGADVNVKDGSRMTPLQVAVKSGARLDLVKVLLDSGADVSVRSQDGLTLLHLAITQSDAAVAAALVGKGAPVDARSSTGATPLHLASGLGHLQLVELLLDGSADVNSATIEGLTPLHEAAGEGHLQVVNALLERGAQVNAHATEDHFRPLHAAACDGHAEVVDALLSHGAEVDAMLKNSGKSALYLALESGQGLAAKVLLRHRADVWSKTSDGSTILHAAAIGDDAEMIQLVLRAMMTSGQQKYLEVANHRGDTALILAAWSKKKTAVDTLLKLGANPNARNRKGYTGLHYAARNGDVDMCGLCSVDATSLDMVINTGDAALHLAIQSNHSEVVSVLLQRGANVHLLNCGYFTPLHLAAEQGFAKILELLCQFGADVNAANNVDAFTPLHLAAMEGHAKAVTKLVLQGALLDQPLKGYDVTPLYLAVQNGHVTAAKKLLDSGSSPVVVKHPSSVLHAAVASGLLEMVELVIGKINSEEPTSEPFLNATDYAGDTPLMWAAQSGKLDICKLLLNHGAGVHLENVKKMTALHWAASNGHPDVVKLLLRYRAKRDHQDVDGNTPLYLAMCAEAVRDEQSGAFARVVQLLSRK